MSLQAWVLGVLLAIPVSKHDRNVPPEEKREQIETIATAITTAAEETRWPGDVRELAALLVVVARYESGLALHVHAGNCRPHECDRGRARGLWQQQVVSTSSPAAWMHLGGLDLESTTFAALEAARALARARWTCRSLESVPGVDWAEFTVSGYAGLPCLGRFPGRNARVAAFRRLLSYG